MNPTTPRFHVPQSGPHEWLKGKWALTSLDSSCDLLRSLFINFFDVVEFVSSKSFQWYLWCYYRSFDVPPIFFFLSSSLCNLWKETREKKLKNKKNLKGTSKLGWWHHQYYWKSLDVTNPTTLKKIINSSIVCHISRPKMLSLLTFGLLVWPIPVIIDNFFWYCWIHLIEIFLIILIVSLSKSKYQNEFQVFFLLLNVVFIKFIIWNS
jgi:hypothetical protein